MNNSNLHTKLLLVCVVLLVIIAIGVWTRPSLGQIDERIQHWGQHYGVHFSR